jgi:hypothetical protein
MSASECGHRSPSRRDTLRAAGLAGLAAFWSQWRQADASAALGSRRARSVILIFNAGAPSHIDLFDPKPDAPSTVRGPFRPIATTVPGVRFSELLPRLARQAHRLGIVRSVHHSHTQHNSGMYWSIVGRPYRVDNTLINPSRNDYPSFGTLVGWLARHDGQRGSLPPYVITPAPHCDSTVYITPGQFGGCLGARYDPFVLGTDPAAADFRVSHLRLAANVTVERLDHRRTLLGKLDGKPRHPDFEASKAGAFDLVRSAVVQRAFDLSREPPAVRDRYGRHSWGQSHLLARRVVEAGVRFVTTVNGPSIVWDTHANNFQQLKNRLVPPMEQAYSALLDDLTERGLLDETLVVWMGDFGRTPLINAGAGRDHWPQCYTMVLAGGGVAGGVVVGESDRQGALPKSQPVGPADIHATVFTALGHDPQRTTYLSPEGRPFPLSEGEPIRQLLR